MHSIETEAIQTICNPHTQAGMCTRPQGREVEDEDQFHFNTEFSERLYRIKINAIQMKETVEENKKTNDQVLQDRQYQVGARISPCSILLSSLWTSVDSIYPREAGQSILRIPETCGHIYSLQM